MKLLLIPFLVTLIDADTIRYQGVSYRLALADAFEYRQTCTRRGKTYRCGLSAMRFVRRKFGGRTWHCELTGRKTSRRTGNRPIIICRVNGKDVAEGLIRGGWALLDERFAKQHPIIARRYRAAQGEAKAARRGVWAGTFVEPWVWRRR